MKIQLNTADSEGLKNIAKALKSNLALEYLNLTCYLCDGLIEFAEALKENRTLTVLRLELPEQALYESFTEEEERAWPDKCAAAFGSAFEINDTLLYCFVSELRQLSEEAEKALEESLSKNRSLEVCDMASTSPFDQKAISLHFKRIGRKKINLLWNIWEEIGDMAPDYGQRQSLFAGCEFSLYSVTTASGSKFRLNADGAQRPYLVDLAEAVGLFENTAPRSGDSIFFTSYFDWLQQELADATMRLLPPKYTSYFQWLPKEVAEDMMKLPLSQAEIESEQQRILKRHMPSDFWSQPPPKRLKIEDKGEGKAKGFGST